MAVLLTYAPGPSTTAPTRIGAPIASAARSICRAASALRYGSMSELFSGQMTTSGCGCSPAAHRGGELEGALRVVVEHGAALGVEVQPGARARCPG